ncbi:MAG: hypothetical protein GEU82_14685 [Luteitalea sp.]|nr:hypothetical protein [Luteitalea sp.]
MRHRLSWLVGAWLACQFASGVVVPGSVMAAGPSAELCTCPGGMPAQICPMHGGGGRHDDTRDDSRCVIRSLSVAPDGLLLSLLGNVGVLPAMRSVAFQPPVAPLQAQIVRAPLTRSDIPDPPPPRA